jgi:hypothetical protein
MLWQMVTLELLLHKYTPLEIKSLGFGIGCLEKYIEILK